MKLEVVEGANPEGINPGWQVNLDDKFYAPTFTKESATYIAEQLESGGPLEYWRWHVLEDNSPVEPHLLDEYRRL